MVLIGCDFHPSWQQVCWLDLETGETEESKLVHAPGAAETYYRRFPAPARMGLESTGNCPWFVDLLAKMGMRCGSGTRRRFAPARCGSRSMTGGMRRFC